MSTPALNPLVEKVRAKYPGAYDDMDDATLTKKLLTKYPQYSDLAVPPTSSMPGAPSQQPMASPSAADRFATAAGAATANMIPNRETLSHMMNDRPAAGEGDSSILPEALNNAAKGTVRATFTEPYQRAMSGDLAGAAGQFLPNALALGASARSVLKGLRSAPAETIPARQALPEAARPAPMLEAGVPDVPAAKPIKPADVRAQLEQALGNEPIKLKPGVPIKDQFKAAPRMEDVPEGHTPVDSSAVKSYKYDADAREFHIRTNSGNATYVYGDVSPEEAQAFADAESKGKAFQQIRSNPLVAKVIGGKRFPFKPLTIDTDPSVPSAPKPKAAASVDSEDLTDILQQSLQKVLAAKRR